MPDRDPALRASVDLISHGADHAIGGWGQHLIGVWDGRVALESVQIWSREIRARVGANPGKVVYLSYERTGFRLPDEPSRKLVADTLRLVDGKLLACVVVLPGNSFIAAGVRALVSGIALAARPRTPLTSVATVEQAHHWVAQVAAPRGWETPEALREAISELESSVGPR
jgi:hypothetical protein